MMLELYLALSLHLNGEAYDLNNVHPHVRVVEGNYIVGVYYNSDYEYSFYGGYKWGALELGIVSGYSDELMPFARVVQDGFFVAPAIYGNGDEYGLVAGYELGF